MKKLLVLVGLTSLAVNSVATGIIISKNNVQNSLNKSQLNMDDKLINESKSNKKQEINEELLSSTPSLPSDVIDQILPFINNSILSNDSMIPIIEQLLKNLSSSTPEINDYLSYFQFGPSAAVLANELANDWDQQLKYGTSSLKAMENYINSSKGDIAQAKIRGSKGQWHYVKVRAGNWSWDDFYQYIAGANMNYMVKILSNGNYIGNLIDKHLHLGPFDWSFDKVGFLNDFGSALQKLSTNKAAWPYLIRTIVPLLKTKILNTINPTLGFKNLTWEGSDRQDLSLKTLLSQVVYLLSPAGHNDLVKIFTSLLSGPFGEDIIIDCGMLGYYTFTELLEVVNNTWPLNAIVGDGLKPAVLAEEIVSELTKIVNDLKLSDIFKDLINKIKGGMSENLVVDLEDLATDLNTIYQTNNFQTGLDQLIDLINNQPAFYSVPSYYERKNTLKEIFVLWGVQKGADNFKTDSPLFVIKKWIDNPKSLLNQALNILRNLDHPKTEPF